MGCSDGGPAPSKPPVIFEKDFRQSYAQVRQCRAPGEHSGLNGFTVWVNHTGGESFGAIWQTPPSVKALVDGAIVVKELYTSQDCEPSSVDHWVAMRKETGFDPAHGDWHWQEVSPAGDVISDGAVATCSTCHTGDTSSCMGYGATAGRDYLCTAP